MYKEDSMKKRIAYIGLSYPLFYDYENQAKSADNDLISSPNPIIESPLGLMILYDELWFLCESLCPNNMRNLPYVKFVDKEIVGLNFEGVDKFIDENIVAYKDTGEFYSDIWHEKREEIKFGMLDMHTHSLNICGINTNANCGLKQDLLFDAYVVQMLQFKVDKSIELVTNSMLNLADGKIANKESELVEKIIIPNVPNYLSEEGPYHEAIEELRNDSFLVDFRKWIIEEREQIKIKECNEIKNEVNNAIQQKKEELFNKYINYNIYQYNESVAKTLIGTAIAPIGMCFALSDHLNETTKLLEVSSTRWQGFVNNAQYLARNHNL